MMRFKEISTILSFSEHYISGTIRNSYGRLFDTQGSERQLSISLLENIYKTFLIP